MARVTQQSDKTHCRGWCVVDGIGKITSRDGRKDWKDVNHLRPIILITRSPGMYGRR